ncbi:D-alanyl-D-alanine carboxypeptidase family protein [Senimuribacter intestinalis]|uniref:D-alanyl-D-alanine carboxypeptidase family protein n=1 Tax=Senimuribacter intestinalis TaxID=2941507 RepID=UPI00203A6577|nr:serine hydrolase [Senimuribacter intestinalis]
MKKKLISVILVLSVVMTMCFGAMGTVYAGDQMQRVNLAVSVDGNGPVTVKAYNASYAYNMYVSVKDLCSALSGSEKQMNFKYDEESGKYIFTTGKAYEAVGGENAAFDVTYSQNPKEGQDDISLSTPGMTTPTNMEIDGKPYGYSVYKAGDDIYMKILDLGFAFGLETKLTGKNALSVNTKKNFSIDIDQLDKNGYFSFLHGAIVGNADTGEILYASNENVQTQLASTTKLMTYLLVQEAIDKGKISLDTKVKISEAVMEEANSEDSTGICRNNFELGKEVSVRDLLAGFLLPSANECGTALAEAVSGSEEAFVKLMNKRAKALGLSSAVFYNVHGLPNYDSSAVTAKRQNSMSAKDMFKLASYLLKNYQKELTAFTGQTQIELPTFGEGVVATSTYGTLIYNLGAIGLKTGTTNRSGANMVTAVPVTIEGKTQNIVSVIFGAEGTAERYEKSTMLIEYAKQYYAAKDAVKAVKVKVSTKTGTSGITISWKKTGSAVDGYQVYRATKKNGTYKKIVTTKKLSALNKSTTKGKTYYYKVRGYKKIDGHTVYTPWSDKVAQKR